MSSNAISLRYLALRLLAKKWDTAWDSSGTVAETLPARVSRDQNRPGTPISQSNHKDKPGVPLSQSLGAGHWDTAPGGTAEHSPDTQVLSYDRVFQALVERCPDHVAERRWRQAIEDGRSFVAQWGEQAEALGWTARDLFGLHEVPPNPHPSYQRLSRYDCTGLIWLLQGCPIVALTETTAAIQSHSGSINRYWKHRKPAFGPLGDTLDDFVA